MEIQNIYLKKVSEVMTKFNPVYPEPYSWEKTIAYMLNDKEEKSTVDQLIEELKNSDNKTFREPIRLERHEIEEDEDDDDWKNPFSEMLSEHSTVEEDGKKYSYIVADGTHRLVAAYLAGVEDILVTKDVFNEEMSYLMITDINVEDKRIEFSEEEDDMLFWVTRSLRISDKNWLTSSVASGGKGNTSTYWDGYTSEIELEEITAKVEERLETLFPNISFKVTTFLEPWDDEEEIKADEEIWEMIEEKE